MRRMKVLILLIACIIYGCLTQIITKKNSILEPSKV